MKKIIVVLLVLFLTGCGYQVYWGTFDFDTVDDVLEYVSDTIVYVPDEVDYWQGPAETLELKTGDCEDFCILFMWLLHSQLNLDAEMLIVRNGNGGEHAMARLDGVVYDVTSGRTVEIPGDIILCVIPYAELFP